MPEQIQLKLRGSQPFLESFIESLKEQYIVIPTSPIMTPPGEAPYCYLTIVEVDR